MRYHLLHILTTIILLPIFLRAQQNKHIIGDTIVESGSIKNYSVQATLASIEWKILPQEAGHILSHHQTVEWLFAVGPSSGEVDRSALWYGLWIDGDASTRCERYTQGADGARQIRRQFAEKYVTCVVLQ